MSEQGGKLNLEEKIQDILLCYKAGGITGLKKYNTNWAKKKILEVIEIEKAMSLIRLLEKLHASLPSGKEKK